MEHTTSLREKAIFWWKNDLELMEDVFLIEKHLHEDSDYTPSNEEIETIYLKEHPTEAEVSKEEETVEDYDETINERIERFQKAMETHDNEHAKNNKVQDIKEAYYYKGRRDEAIWQKEKDRELISELLDTLKVTKTLNLHLYEPETVGNRAYNKINEAMKKAEKHLNNQ